MSQYLPPELRKTGNVDDVIFYTDAGVTGTHAEIRPEFQHMVADAKLGKVDIVSVKNISRFARSLKDAIRYITEEGILSPYKHEAIISEEDFTKVQEICYQRAHVPEARSCAVPLTGLIRCGRCGCTFVRHADRGMTAWACSSYQKNVTCPGKSIKTTHDDTIKRLYAEAVYLLKADAKRYGQGHYTLDQINGVEEIDEDCDKIRSYVKGITIGSEKVERLVTFEFLCGAYVQFETTPTDVHYRKELIIRLWAK